MGPAIKLEKYEIEELHYCRQLVDSEISDKDLTLEFESAITEDSKNGKVTLKAKYIDKDFNKKILARVTGYFSINVKEDVKEYLMVNGCAIVFPYLRSAISMISSLDSSEAVLIPTVNVLELLEKQRLETAD